jgi:GNAT superfamily N-acetyltransferase
MELTYTLATEPDLIEIVRMLADDTLGGQQENVQEPLTASYVQAIAHDPHQELTVVKLDREIAATFQLSFIPYLTYQGRIRAQIEAVRVKSGHQRKGIGKEIFNYAIQRAKVKEAYLLRLTTDKKRPEAKQFYLSPGFVDSHEGMKMYLY